MNSTIADLMRSTVMTATPHQTAGHVRKVMAEHHISALPVVGPDDEALGIVTASDLLADHAEAAPVSSFMSTPALTVPSNEQPHVVARIMRNHHRHHVIVTRSDKVVGVISAYDLLELVEEHRFVMKQPPTPSNKGSKRV
jgi:CBS domain-containing protein